MKKTTGCFRIRFLVFSAILVFTCLTMSKAVHAGKKGTKGNEKKDEQPIADTTRGDEKPEYLVHDGKLIIKAGGKQETVALPGKVRSYLVLGDRLYVLLEGQGIGVMDLKDPQNPVLIDVKRPPLGNVIGMFVADSRVWMRIRSLSAIPIGNQVTSPAVINLQHTNVSRPSSQVKAQTSGKEIKRKGLPAEQRGQGGKPLPKNIKVVNRFPGRVKLNIGSLDGVKVGDRFVAFGSVTRKMQGDSVKFKGHELAAILTVAAVSPKSCLAELGRGDRVSTKDVIRPARKEDRGSRIFPRKLVDLGEFRTAIRPLLKIGKPLGFGILAEIAATWWGNGYFLDLRIDPLGFGYTKDGNPFSSCFLVQGGYDTRAFSVGLGIGVGGVNGDLGELLVGEGVKSDSSGNSQSWHDRTVAAFALSQHVRLGARDGLNMVVTNTLMYYKSKNDSGSKDSGFVYGGTSGRINIPLPGRTDLFLSGGGGLVGYWFAEFGVFTWITGNGDIGSLGLSASAGGAGIWGTQKRVTQYGFDQRTVDVVGPMVSFGLAYRFGI
ncbi:MAG: hypothetical protein GXP49_18830 [Deltaproteobacteria bacterium]|nr:hypothetical protein [Deltaproteobacteria bacterium]